MTSTHTDAAAQAADPTAASSLTDVDPRLIVDQEGIRGYAIAFVRRLRGGELGSLPVILGLVVIWAIFYAKQSAFLSSQNLSNLAVQMVPIGMISVGIVLVLLLGEVDLSVGSVSGAAAALMAVQIVQHGASQPLGIVYAVLLGVGLGAVHGLFFSRLGVPSFVVTLAGLLAWEGLQLRILGKTGTVQITDGLVFHLTHVFLTPTAGYLIAAVVTAVVLGGQLLERAQRARAGLRPRPTIEIAVRTLVVAAVAFVAVAVFDHYTGTPLALVIFIVVVVAFDLLIRRTTYGRHVLAVGGNVEAARRAGISVWGIRLSVFMIAGGMAALGGVFDTSRLLSASAATGGDTTVLYAIAAAVIGGTSLFGGRGSAYSALLGILVITSITNGMAILGLQSATQFIVTGAVTLAAVTLDSISRRSQRSSGRG